jgi:hypothetical protein
MRNLTALESAILIGAVRDLQGQQQLAYPGGYGSVPMKRRYLDAQDGVVRCDPSSWLEYSPATAAERMAVSRAYVTLEKRGLVVRVAGGYSATRVTHLRPTDAGRELAAQLREAEAVVDG